MPKAAEQGIRIQLAGRALDERLKEVSGWTCCLVHCILLIKLMDWKT